MIALPSVRSLFQLKLPTHQSSFAQGSRCNGGLFWLQCTLRSQCYLRAAGLVVKLVTTWPVRAPKTSGTARLSRQVAAQFGVSCLLDVRSCPGGYARTMAT